MATKGHDVLRVGVLRDTPVVPLRVAPEPVSLDAGSDALTDEELDALARELPRVLDEAFRGLPVDLQKAARVGTAHVAGCRLRAGPSPSDTVYMARCRIKLVVDGTVLAAVEAEAVRRTLTRAISPAERDAHGRDGRSPLLAFDDSRRALEAALEAAARVLATGSTSREDQEARALSRTGRAALARARVERLRAPTTDGASGSEPDETKRVRAALFDLRAVGRPDDATRVEPFLAHTSVEVREDAADAIGELCAPASAPALAAQLARVDENEQVRDALSRALARVRACHMVAQGSGLRTPQGQRSMDPR